MDGLVQLSKQMAAYDKAMHDRLDRVEFKLDNIEATNRQILYWPLATCKVTKNNIANTIHAGGFKKLDLTDFEQAKLIPASVSFTNQVMYCINYLETLYGVAFDPGTLGFNPLALRYSQQSPNGVYAVKPDSQESVNQYETAMQAFLNRQFGPTLRFVDSARKAKNPFGNDNPLPNGVRLTSTVAMFALPARNLPSYRTKTVAFSKPAPVCAQGTLLSNPLVGVVCRDAQMPIAPTLITLPTTSSSAADVAAEQRASNMMNNAFAQDSLVELAGWAEFFAPIYDYADLAHNTVFTDRDQFLGQPLLEAKGPRLLEGALQTLTFGLTQANMLYGDTTAGMIFSALWDDAKGFPTDVPNLSQLQKQALGLLTSGNPYLQRNVLMMALDRASTATESGQQFAYQNALDLMTTSTVDPEAQLGTLFGHKLQFKNLWRPISVPMDDQEAVKAQQNCETTHDIGVCLQVPSAAFLGVDVPLPSADQFGTRTLVYPRFLLDLLGTRDRVAQRLADYRAVTWSVAKEPDPTAAKANVAKTLITAYQ